MAQKASPDQPGCGDVRGGTPSHGGGAPGTGPPASSGPVVSRSLIPAPHVRAIGVKRPGYGSAGTSIKVITNHFETEFNQGIIYHYDVILPDKPLPVARNFEIIDNLQTNVEP
ncbi:hypothetical protein BJV78DRAFT_1283159 [Lactifluus subvellereus]|nr:hypothetical protein BJV78DRAFT_1283159 [Lactifluus subvellereus]